MDELTVAPKSIGGWVRALSGLFITKDNPNGLTPKECQIVSILRTLLQDSPDGSDSKIITKEIKIELSNQLNQSLQVTTNYVNKFKLKGVVTKDDALHVIFFTDRIIIDGKNIL